jgi:hypothetical protein
MGMSMIDFYSCTPLQFKAIYGAWAEAQSTALRQQWEQSRMVCMCMLQPYSKKRLQPRDVMKFPWDKKEQEEAERKQLTPRKDLSREELMQRYRAAVAAAGR